MKHNYLTLLLAVLMSMVSTCKISAATIYFRITSSTEFTVSISYRGNSWSEYSNEYSGDLVIPETVKISSTGITYRVTAIGDDSFHGCTDLTSIAIPNSVTSIGSDAFAWCI